MFSLLRSRGCRSILTDYVQLYPHTPCRMAPLPKPIVCFSYEVCIGEHSYTVVDELDSQQSILCLIHSHTVFFVLILSHVVFFRSHLMQLCQCRGCSSQQLRILLHQLYPTSMSTILSCSTYLQRFALLAFTRQGLIDHTVVIQMMISQVILGVRYVLQCFCGT